MHKLGQAVFQNCHVNFIKEMVVESDFSLRLFYKMLSSQYYLLAEPNMSIKTKKNEVIKVLFVQIKPQTGILLKSKL